MPAWANSPGRSEIHARVKGRRQPPRPHEQHAHYQQDDCDAERHDNPLGAWPSKAKLTRPAPPRQQKPIGRCGRCDDHQANENPALAAIAPEDGCRPMKEAEDQEQPQHQTKPVGPPFNHAWCALC